MCVKLKFLINKIPVYAYDKRIYLYIIKEFCIFFFLGREMFIINHGQVEVCVFSKVILFTCN